VPKEGLQKRIFTQNYFNLIQNEVTTKLF